MDHLFCLGLSAVNVIVASGMDTSGFDVWDEERRILSCVTPTDWLVDATGGSPNLGGSKRGKGLPIRENLLWINSSSSTDIFLERKTKGN